MTLELDMKLRGTRSVEELSKDVQRDLNPGLKPRLQEAADILAKEGRARTHSSRVKKAITSTVKVKSPTDFEARIGTVRKKAFFAHFLEFGTSHSAAFPFMKPALTAKQNQVVELIGRLPSLQ